MLNLFTQLGQDIDGEAAGDNSGWSVSLNARGDIVAIGATNNNSGDGQLLRSGHVRVYQYNYSNNRWNQLGPDIDGGFAGDFSGYSVSINAEGYIVAIGSIFSAGEDAVNSGRTRVYKYNHLLKEWEQIGQDIDGAAAGDNSGWSVSLNAEGYIVAIGAPYGKKISSSLNIKSGYTRVYQYHIEDDKWNQLGNPIYGDYNGDQSGWSVSINGKGDIVAIGSTGIGPGRTQVYQYDTSKDKWNQLGNPIFGEREGESSGFSVSINADGYIVAIGAALNSGKDGSFVQSGQTRVYQYDFSEEEWNQLGQDIYGERAGDRNGYSVSINAKGYIVAIGAVYNDGGDSGQFSNTGHTQVYQYNPSNNKWNQLGQDIDGESAVDSSGWSVSINAKGDIVAIGAIGNDGGEVNPNSGHTRVYQYISGSKKRCWQCLRLLRARGRPHSAADGASRRCRSRLHSLRKESTGIGVLSLMVRIRPDLLIFFTIIIAGLLFLFITALLRKRRTQQKI
jgi:hypothetical protein